MRRSSFANPITASAADRKRHGAGGALIATCLITALAGCAPSPSPPTVQRPPEPASLATFSPDLQTPDDWSPSIGRMDPSLCARHLPPQTVPRLIWGERFTDATPTGLPNWRALGSPTLKLVRLAGANGIEISSLGRWGGYERALEAAALAGKDVRLELRFACPSARRAAALDGASVSVVANARGRTSTVKLPIVADVTPGWETQSWCVRFRPDIRAASIRLEAAGPDASLTCSRLAIYEETWGSALAGQLPTSRPADNLIVDGDFETGQPRFAASAARRWPDGSELVMPVNWRFSDDKAAGRQALQIEAIGETTRVLFGPIDLSSAQRMDTQPEGNRPFRVSFYARCARPAAVTATLRSTGGVIGQATFQPTATWNWYSADLTRPFGAAAAPDARWAEVVFDIVTADSDVEPNATGFDALRLAVAEPPTTSAPVRPQPFEIGLIAEDGAENADLRNIFDVRDGVSFTARVIGDSKGPVTGQLILDLLDASDRVVWTRDLTPKLDAAGRYEEPVQLAMPRGYYRALATLWSGAPGRSEYRAHTSLSMAVISLDDSVPIGGPFGLSAVGGAISLRSTQLGAAWVRCDLPAARVEMGGKWDFTLWQWLMGRGAQADLDVVAALSLPSARSRIGPFLNEFLSVHDALPAAVVLGLHPPGSTRSAADPHLVRNAISARGVDVQVVLASAGSTLAEPLPAGGATDVLGIAASPAQIPEASEAPLERIANTLRRTGADKPVWDLAVPVHLGQATHWSTPHARDETSPVSRIPIMPDPLRSASRMVRATLIRGVAGARRVGLDALALAPLRTCLEQNDRRLHEPDYSPRVAVAALDAMAGLLNDATLKRWIDLPGGGRVLYYEKDDGRAVAALWRPFGQSPTRISFDRLPEAVELLDVTGVTEPAEVLGTRRLVSVNELVRYLVAPADLRETLRASLEAIQVLPAAPDR